MGNRKGIIYWLETHWVAPAYSGWLLGTIAGFFFAAAANTLSGWLYVISGVVFALLTIAALLPAQTLRPLRITRLPIAPVTVSHDLLIEVVVDNPTDDEKTLLQITDLLPLRLGKPAQTSIEVIGAKSAYHWSYCQPTDRRGVYHWQEVQLRTGVPLGLFWCTRSRIAKATAIVYPTVLPLTHCPLVDTLGQEDDPQYHSDHRHQNATEGVTRSLRPYRWGDPIRLIHWRTSARYGEFRVRELEVFTGGQEIVISLDTAKVWQSVGAIVQPSVPSASEDISIPADSFEQAVISAASLYFYLSRQNSNVKLWTAGTGLVQGNRAVLQALAATYAGEDVVSESPPALPLVWLTENAASLSALPPGSRWILWNSSENRPFSDSKSTQSTPGLLVQTDQPLQRQLQSSIR